MRKNIWLIPMGIGVLWVLVLGGLGLIMLQIGMSPGLYFKMDPTYPIYLGLGVYLIYYSYKKWRKWEASPE